MACDLLSGIGRECNDSQGGLKNVYLFNFVDNAFTVSAGVATAINPLVTTVFEYAVDGDTKSYTEEMVPSNDAGTVVNTQTLTFFLKKISATKSANLNILAKGKTIAVTRDRNDVYNVLGLDEGIFFTVAPSTGSAMADANGYTLTGTAMSKNLAPALDSATITAFLALVD